MVALRSIFRVSSIQSLERWIATRDVIVHSLQQRWLAHFSSPTSSPAVQTLSKEKRVHFKAYEKAAAAEALCSYLANQKSFALEDAGNISKGAPNFVRKLLLFVLEDSSSKSLERFTSGNVRAHVEAFLEKQGVNEVEPFLESIGVNPGKIQEALPLLSKDLSGEQSPIKLAKILVDHGIAWKDVWKVFKKETHILELTQQKLSAQLLDLEGLGFDKKGIAELILSLPLLSKDLSGKRSLIGLAKILVDYGVPWKDVWRAFKDETCLLDLTPQELSARLVALEGLGFDKKGVTKLIQDYPSALRSSGLRLNFTEEMKLVTQQMEYLGVKQEFISCLVESNQSGRFKQIGSNMRKNFKILRLCKLSRPQLSELLRSRPEIIVKMSTDEMADRIESLKGLKLVYSQIGRIISRFPDILLMGHAFSLRVEFLKKLGFQIEEIGKLIRRDPALLIRCKESRLFPILSYFETLGINQEKSRKVIAAFPAVIGYSLDDNLKPTIRFFESIGLNQEIIGNLIVKAPSVLALNVDQNIMPKIKFLESIGVSKDNIVKVIARCPQILKYSIEKNYEPKVAYLKSIGFDDSLMEKLIRFRPTVFGRSIKDNLSRKVEFLVDLGFGLGSTSLARALGYIFTLSFEALDRRLLELEGLGLTKGDVRIIIRRAPGVLYLSMRQLKEKMLFLDETLGYPVKDLVHYPFFFYYSLERRIKPRHRFFVWLKEKGYVKEDYSFWSLLSTKESEFEENFVRRFPDGELVFSTESGTHSRE